MSFDRIDKQFRQRPEIKFEAFAAGQDCPKPQCRGKLKRRPDQDCGSYLGCDAPGCGWSERTALEAKGT